MLFIYAFKSSFPKLFNGSLGICDLSGRNLSLHTTCNAAKRHKAAGSRGCGTARLDVFSFLDIVGSNLFERAFDGVDDDFYGSCTLFE